MATDIRALPAYLSNDADFRTWGQGIAAQVANCGLVKTADTGQIDWATVARPAAGVVAGYEIYRFDDALQATKPVFVKIEYGAGAVANDRPGLWVTAGTATNGAGTITGQVGNRLQLSPSTSKTAGATLNSYCSGSTSRLSLCTNLDTANANFHMMTLVERTRDATGTPTGDAIATYNSSVYAGVKYQLVPFSGTIPTASSGSSPGPCLGNQGARMADGADVALAPWLAYMGKVLFMSPVGYLHTDIGELATFTATYWGATHTFMPLGDGVGTHAIFTTATFPLAFLWE